MPRRASERLRKLGELLKSIVPTTLGLSALALSINQYILANELANASVYDRIVVMETELDKVFISNPEVRPYIYDNKALPPTDPYFDKFTRLRRWF